ncbi:MAG TPA: diguanylate cyclase, partial [Chloroflexota bacterium]
IVAKKILTSLEQPFVVEGQSLDIGGSIGIALHPEHGEESDTLMHCADVAMYVAKRAKGGHAVYSHEQETRLSPRHRPHGVAEPTPAAPMTVVPSPEQAG